MCLYAYAYGDGPFKPSACQRTCIDAASQWRSWFQWAAMYPLQFSSPAGVRFLSELRHESQNGGLPSLWTKG